MNSGDAVFVSLTLIPSKAVKDKAIRKRRFEDAGAAEMQDNAMKRGL